MDAFTDMNTWMNRHVLYTVNSSVRKLILYICEQFNGTKTMKKPLTLFFHYRISDYTKSKYFIPWVLFFQFWGLWNGRIYCITIKEILLSNIYHFTQFRNDNAHILCNFLQLTTLTHVLGVYRIGNWTKLLPISNNVCSLSFYFDLPMRQMVKFVI